MLSLYLTKQALLAQILVLFVQKQHFSGPPYTASNTVAENETK